MRTSQASQSFWTKLTLGVTLIVVLVAKYLGRNQQASAYGPSIFLPPNQTFDLDSTPDIIRYLDAHCVHHPRMVFGGVFAAADYRACDIRDANFIQECRSNLSNVKFDQEGTTTNATCDSPQLINTTASTTHSEQRRFKKNEAPIKSDRFCLLGTMRFAEVKEDDEFSQAASKAIEKILERADKSLRGYCNKLM